jgi:hypothetical protein
LVFFPLVAAVVAVVFAVMLFRRFARSKSTAQLAWGVAMAMYAAASFAVANGTYGGWDKTLFKIYWLFGAMLNVPFLALGSIALLRKVPLTWLAMLIVAAATLYGFGVVLTSGLDTSPMTAKPFDIPRGKEVWDGALAGKLGSAYSIPAYLVVVAIAFLTSRRGEVPRERVRANWLIAAGATIVALGGFTLARLARGAFFSIFLALGISVMFAGFMTASAPPRARAPEPPAPKPPAPEPPVP